MNQTAFLARTEPWDLEMLAVAGSNGIRHSEIHAHDRPAWLTDNRWLGSGEGDVPAARPVPSYPGHAVRADRPREAKPDLPTLGHTNLGPFPTQPPDRDIAHAEPLIRAFPAPAG